MSTDTHPSLRWTERAFVADRGTTPTNPDRFAELMAQDRRLFVDARVLDVHRSLGFTRVVCGRLR